MRHSLVILPEPMRPRLFDPRVGVFNLSYTRVADSGTSQQSLILRHRLEKADPAAPVSDPIEPIVYYLAPEMPEIWKPAIRRGILSWNREPVDGQLRATPSVSKAGRIHVM